MENEQSINNLLSEFDRSQKKARRFNMAATVVGVIAAIGMIGLIAVIAYKYTYTEKTLTSEVTQTKSELDTKASELQLTKTQLTTKQTELTRLQDTVKNGSGSADVITSLQRDLSANQLKLANANDQINELKGMVTTIQGRDDVVATLTKQLTEKENSINTLKNQVVEKDKAIAVKDETISRQTKLIQTLTRKGQVNVKELKDAPVNVQ